MDISPLGFPPLLQDTLKALCHQRIARSLLYNCLATEVALLQRQQQGVTLILRSNTGFEFDLN